MHLFLDTAIMTDRMRDDKNEASTKLSPTSANKHPSNAQKRSCDEEIPKKKKFQRTDTSKSICDDKNRSLVHDIHFHGKKYTPAEGEDVICDYAHDSQCNRTCLPWDNKFLILQMYPEEKIYVFLVLMSFKATATLNVLGLKASFA